MCADIIDINKTIEDLEKDGLQIVSQHIFKYYIRNFNIKTLLLNYCSFFLKNGKFIPGTTSSDLIALYNFDKNLGNHIFRDILILEKIINTNVVYATINYFKIKDKKLFNLPKDFIIKNILVNVNNIKPPLAADALMYKMTKFLDANSELRNYIDKSIKDPIIR
jgi:hypothetical protein